MAKHPPQQSIIFSDFDETIINTATYSINPHLTKLIFDNPQLPIVVVTSRNWEGLASYKDLLHLSLPQITENGATIINPINNNVLYNEPITAGSLTELQSLIQKFSVEVSYSTALSTHNTSDIEPGEPIGRVSLVGDHSTINTLLTALKNTKGIKIHQPIAQPDSRILVDITNATVDKKKGIESWFSLQKSRYQTIYVVGNGTSDISMFEVSIPGSTIIRVAVEDAHAALKQKADRIIPSAERNGFLHFFESLTFPSQ
jgi:hydroxymethylpyrimidine pyrophosphatase-like HAD family hydrolase